MRYLVTGGAGFIGSNTVDELVRRGHDVVVLDDLSAGKAAIWPGKNKNQIDARQHHEFGRPARGVPRSGLRDSPGGPDFRAAFGERPDRDKSDQRGRHAECPGRGARRESKTRRVRQLLRGLRKNLRPSRFRRAQPLAPISPYGISKQVGEAYGHVFQELYGLEFVSLRYFNVFGPRQDPGSPYSGVLSLFNAALLAGTQPTVYGDGEQSRDFVYVENVVEANLLAAEAKGAPGLPSTSARETATR